MTNRWMNHLPPYFRKRLEGRSYLQNVVGNMGWLFGEKALRMGVGLLVGIWVARFLGPDRFGLLSYALAFVSMFSAIAGLGLDGIVVRELVRNPSGKDEILGSAIVMKCLSGMAVFIMVLVAIRLLRPVDSLTNWLVGITALGMIFNAMDPVDFWFQSQVQSKYSVIARCSPFLLISVIKIALILFDAPLIAFAVAGCAEIAFISLGMLIAYHVSGNRILAWSCNAATAGRLLRDSWPLILSGVAIMVYMRIDQVMIGEMIGSREVGIYSVAVQLVEVWYLLPGIIIPPIFPSIVEAKDMGETIYYDRLQKLYNFMALMSYAIAIPVTVLGKWAIRTFYGSAYADAGPMLVILIWSIVFTNLGIARSAFLTTMNWTKVHLMTVAIGGVINVILNYFLIPSYGGMGAVIASCVAYWFATHGACFIYPPLQKTGVMLTKAILYPKIW